MSAGGGFGRLTALFARIEQLPTTDRRLVRFLIVSSTLVLIGLTVTGIAVFVEHEANLEWTKAASRGLGFPVEPRSTGLEDLHATFGTIGGIIALIGGGVLALRVLYRVAGVVVAGLAMAVFGAITGSMIRFNAVERSDGFDPLAQGYQQFFGGDVVRVITDRSDFGSTTMAALTVAHLVTVPIIIVSGWFTLKRADDERERSEALAQERLRRRQART